MGVNFAVERSICNSAAVPGSHSEHFIFTTSNEKHSYAKDIS